MAYSWNCRVNLQKKATVKVYVCASVCAYVQVCECVLRGCVWQNSNQKPDEPWRSQIIEGFASTLKSFNFILKTMEVIERFKHKRHIFSVVNSRLAVLWVGEKTESYQRFYCKILSQKWYRSDSTWGQRGKEDWVISYYGGRANKVWK